MSRNLHPAMAAALSGPLLPALLVQLTFRSGMQACWSGTGPLTVGGITYLGVGSLGSMTPVEEMLEVRATGVQLKLSGIDPVFLASAMTDVRLGAPAKIFLALLNPDMTIIGAPYLLFSGSIDKPPVAVGGEKVEIELHLETRMINHARASNRRYTDADQRIVYPDDSAFIHVEELNDIALRWHT